MTEQQMAIMGALILMAPHVTRQFASGVALLSLLLVFLT